MADNDPSEHPESAKQRNGTAHPTTSVVERVGVLSRILSDELASLRGQIKSDKQAGERSLTTYERKQLFWIRFSSILTIALGALVLVVLYLTLAVLDRQREIAGGHLGMMRSQLEEMKSAVKQTEELITAATNQTVATSATARAAKQTVEVIRDNSRLDQRAWVGVIGGGATDIRAGSQATFTVEFINSGKTPALEFVVETAGGMFAKGSKFVPVYPPPTRELSRFVVQPGMRVTTNSSAKMLEANISALKNGASIYKFYGKYSYRDIFKDTPLRSGTFCLYLGLNLKDVNFCEFYNTAN